MTPAIAAEALAAITGLWPSRPLEPRDMLAASGLPERWHGKIRRWMSAEPARHKWTPPPSEEALQKKILAVPTEEETAGWLNVLGDAGVGVDYLAVIQRGRAFLDGIWPKIASLGIVAGVFPLSPDDLCEVWSVCRLLDDPDVLFDEMASQTLTVEQVTAWRTVYPELSALVDSILDDQIAEHVSKKHDLTWQQEDVIRILRCIPSESPIQVPEQSKPGKPPEAVKIDFKAHSTPAERTDAP